MRFRPLQLAIASLALSACASARPATVPFRMGPEAAKARAKADSLRYPYTKADIDFMSGMIHHHAQAILIAGWAPSHGASPSVIRLTERIINAQKDEIVLMSNWLRDRNQSVPEPNPAGMPSTGSGSSATGTGSGSSPSSGSSASGTGSSPDTSSGAASTDKSSGAKKDDKKKPADTTKKTPTAK